MDPWLKQTLLIGLGALLAWALPRLVTKGSADLRGRVKSLEDSAWTIKEKLDLENRLAKIETKIEFVRETQKDFQDTLEQAMMDAAHSPHTPELDALLDKRKKVGLTTDETKHMVRVLSDLIETETERALRSNYIILRGVAQANLRRRQKEKQVAAAA